MDKRVLYISPIKPNFSFFCEMLAFITLTTNVYYLIAISYENCGTKHKNARHFLVDENNGTLLHPRSEDFGC